MLIKEICKICGLTKKAVEYYEKQGLIQPETSENGYRNYTDKDIAQLKEISLLRKLGIPVSDIKSILTSNNKSAALSKIKYVMDLKHQRAAAQIKGIDALIQDYNIDKEIEYVQSSVDKILTVKEKLIQAFPGTYGMYLCIHFGPFLNERINTIEKEAAYHKMVDYLDNLSTFEISPELAEYLENTFSITDQSDMEKMNDDVAYAVDDIESYIEKNKESLNEYLKMRTSPEYKDSPAYKMQQMLLEFQQQSGYYDVFLPNLKILSPSYRVYTEKLEQANQLFLEKYPRARHLHN